MFYKFGVPGILSSATVQQSKALEGDLQVKAKSHLPKESRRNFTRPDDSRESASTLT